MMKIQITFFQKDNKYKPVSTLLEVESMEYYEQHKAETQRRALLNIAHNRKTTPQERNEGVKDLRIILERIRQSKAPIKQQGER